MKSIGYGSLETSCVLYGPIETSRKCAVSCAAAVRYSEACLETSAQFVPLPFTWKIYFRQQIMTLSLNPIQERMP